MRPKTTPEDRAHWALQGWGDWYAGKMEKSALSFPKCSVEGGMMRGRLEADMNSVRGSVVPDVGRSAEERLIDDAVYRMPDHLWYVVYALYVMNVSKRRCAEGFGISRRDIDSREKMIKGWIAGVLEASRAKKAA